MLKIIGTAVMYFCITVVCVIAAICFGLGVSRFIDYLMPFIL